MNDTVLFMSAYITTHHKSYNPILNNIHHVFKKKENVQTLLKKHHISFIAADNTLISTNRKIKVDTHYDDVYQKTAFSFSQNNNLKSSNNAMSFIEGSGVYINLQHAQSVLLDKHYFQIDFISSLSPFLVWINGKKYQIDATIFIMNDVLFIVFEMIDYTTGTPLTKDDVFAKKGNYNLLHVEKYQFFDEDYTINVNKKISDIIYEIISKFTHALTNKHFQYDEHFFMHNIIVFSNNIENISNYMCQLMGTKEPISVIQDISVVNTYKYYPQDGCSVISCFDSDKFNEVLYPTIILETLKIYIHICQISNLEAENDLHRLVKNNIYLQNLLYSPNLPIQTHNVLKYVNESETYKKHYEAIRLKISYLTTQNDLKKNRNSTILNILLYIISLLSAIGTLDVIEAHFDIPFKYSFVAVAALFVLGLIWWVIEYRINRKL